MDINVERLIDAGEQAGPVRSTRPRRTSNGPNTVPADARRRRTPPRRATHVDYWARTQGATSFKAYMQISRDELQGGDRRRRTSAA